MSSRGFGILWGLTLLASGCGNAEPDSTSALHAGLLELRIGESRPISGTSLTVTFQGVSEDSRCPSDVACVWAGNGQVELLIHRPEGDTTLQLNTASGARQAELNGIRLELEHLTPEPRTPGPVPSEEYLASLAINPSLKPGRTAGP